MVERFLFGLTQRRVIVQDVKTATERGKHQIVHTFVNGDVADGDGRQAAFHLNPFCAAVNRKEKAEFRADEKQIRINVVFGNRVERTALGQVSGNRIPGFSRVGAFQNIRLEIAVLMIVE